jgi:hypothetical protein
MLCTAILLPWHVLAAHPSGPTVSARTAPAIAPVDTVDTLAAQLATITTDTGAFAPGHRDFSHYDTPGLCRAAARVTRASFQYSLAAQAVDDTLSEDTIGVGGTAPVARACGARFTLANATGRDLGDLFDLALHEQNDTLAQAVLAKLVAQAATPGARAAIWVFGLQSYLLFGRLVAAEALAQLDMHGAVVDSTPMMMHFLLGKYFDRNGDTVRFRREIEKEIEHLPSDRNQDYFWARKAFQDLMRLAAIGHPDSMPAVAQQAQSVLKTYTVEAQVPDISKDDRYSRNISVDSVLQFTGYVPWDRLSLDSVIVQLAPAWYTYRRKHGGAVAPRLQADYWFPAPGHPSSDTLRPVQGKIDLICLGGDMIDDRDVVFDGMPLYSGYQQAAHIRRWLSQYGAAGLEVTIVRPVSGWLVADHLQNSQYRLFQTFAEEAPLWRWYAQEYEQLPVTVAVQVRHDQWLPQPDGRRWSEPETQVYQYFVPEKKQLALGKQFRNATGGPGSCTIIGRDGVILYSSPGGSYGRKEENQEVEVLLKWLFQGPGASGASTALAGAVPRVSLPPSSHSSPHPLRGDAQ